MSRYIDADAFLKEYCEPYPYVYMAMSKALADAPSIDIVRCKDCKYRDKHHYCGIWGQPYLCNDECFCSYGERKE